ncbi:MAG: hypothetical protein IKV54_05500 [Clostridia bacterium]|nr:hypothetical protein [Clostridia bacterium]
MADRHKLSEFIDNISFKKVFGWGFRPDEVYDTICTLTSMYNVVLADSYRENNDLSDKLLDLEKQLSSQKISSISAASPITADENEPPFGSKEYFAREYARFNNPAAVAQSVTASDLLPDEQASPASSQPQTTIYPPAEEAVPNDKSKEKTAKSKEKAGKDIRLQHLKRADLLEILIEQSRENEMLKNKLNSAEEKMAELQAKLDDRSIKIEKAGTLAEATFLINGVIESSQLAAQQYLDNLEELYNREEINCTQKEAAAEEYYNKLLSDAKLHSESIVQAAEEKCTEITQNAEKLCESMRLRSEEECKLLEDNTKKKCAELETAANNLRAEAERQTEERCAAIEENARISSEKYWIQLSERLEEFYAAHQGLRELLNSTGHVPRI